jgi:Tfp pilus assembly protein PilF
MKTDEMSRVVRAPWIGAVAIGLLALAAHAPALRAGFLWDDEFWLWKSPLTVADNGILRAWFSADRWDFYPVTSSAFWILWRACGENAAGYHALNVLLHGAGAVLVWRVLAGLAVPGAWVAAALFAVHPVTVGTVAWITQLKNVLSLIFYAAALLAWLRFDETDEGAAADRRRWYGVTLGVTIAALLSKASVVLLPVVMLAMVWWRRGRVTRSHVLATLPIFALAAAQSAVTIWFQTNRVIGGAEVATDGIAVRLAAAGRAVWFYAAKALAPVDLAIIYPRFTPDPSSVLVWLPWLALVAVFAVALATRRGPGRPVLFGLGVYVITLLPVLGFFDMYYARYSRVADHWQYLALPALLALIVGGATVGLRRVGSRAVAVPVLIGAVAIVAAGALAFRQATAYRDPGTLWRTVVERNPDAWVAWNGLGTWLGATGDHETATKHFERAIELRPDYPLALRNLGIASESRGDPVRAEESYRRAIAVRADYADARADLGRLLAHRGDEEAATSELREVVRLVPDHLDARYLLAKLRVRAADLPGAAEQLREIVARRPDFQDAAAVLNAVNAKLAAENAAADAPPTPAPGSNRVK